MSELSQFEELAAKTPKKEPLAILGGTVLIVIVLLIINAVAPTDAVKQMKQTDNKVEEAPAEIQPAGEEIDNI